MQKLLRRIWTPHKNRIHLLIDGVEYIAADVGGGVKGKHIDIFYNTHSETKNHGVERSEVYLIQS